MADSPTDEAWLEPLAPRKSGDGGSVEVPVDLAAAAAERVRSGELTPFLRAPRLLLRHGADWLPGPLLVGAAMAALALAPGGLAGLLRLRPLSVVAFLAIFPALIWGVLLVGVETCREDLAGRGAGFLGRWLQRGRAFRRTLPLLGAQLVWLAPPLVGASLGVFPELLAPTSLLALFYAGFSSFFVLAAARLHGLPGPAAFLFGHARALRALIWWPVDLSAHGLVVGERRGRGMLDPSDGSLASRAVASVALILLGACVGLLVWPGHHGFWWGHGPSVADAVFGGLAALGFAAGAQVGAGLTAYEYASLLAAERGLLPIGGWGAIQARPRRAPPELEA